MTHTSVLYDGWPLIYQPNSPEALHLLAILSRHPEGIQAWLALPAEPPAWLPPGARAHVLSTADTPRDHLVWEQRTLPAIRDRAGAVLLHLTSLSPPLFGPAVNVVSPSSFAEGIERGGLATRLRQALSQGGMARLGGLFWPDDLPMPANARPVYRLPPAIPQGFGESSSAIEDLRIAEQYELPEAYVLYHGPSEEMVLRRLLNAWSWVAGPLGEAYPLLAVGLGEAGRERLAALAAENGLGETMRSLPGLPPQALGAIYRRSSALLHPLEEPPWGGPARLALASGTPVVSIESERMDALVGPAAYLVDAGDRRALGAAIVTILVEEGVARQLANAGRQRAATWSLKAFADGLAQAYREIMNRRK